MSALTLRRVTSLLTQNVPIQSRTSETVNALVLASPDEVLVLGVMGKLAEC